MQLSASALFKYVRPFHGHQALNDYDYWSQMLDEEVVY